jgi:hypothetical protein
MVTPLAKSDREGYRAELVALIKKASSIKKHDNNDVALGHQTGSLRSFLSQK